MKNLFNSRKERIGLMKVYRRNKVFVPREIPDNIIKNCESCGSSMLYEDWIANYSVCSTCNHHYKISARERISQLSDNGYFKEFDSKITSINEENFYQYDLKLDQARKNSGLKEAVVSGIVKIEKIKAVLCVMDSNFMMGSMGQVVGEKITRAIEYATNKKLPLIIVTASGGARMQEGILSLMQMAKTSAALKRHNDKGLLYITLLTYPTTGGVSASFAMLGDIILAEPKALVAFAGKRVIEKTINETLPEEFQTSEFLQDKGFVDKIVERKKLKETLHKILVLHGEK